jgi:hypothetical protein
MGVWSVWHWLIVLAALLTVVPVARALIRAGLNPWWAVLSVIPIVGWFALWVFAFAPWPTVDRKPGDRP